MYNLIYLVIIQKFHIQTRNNKIAIECCKDSKKNFFVSELNITTFILKLSSYYLDQTYSHKQTQKNPEGIKISKFNERTKTLNTIIVSKGTPVPSNTAKYTCPSPRCSDIPTDPPRLQSRGDMWALVREHRCS